MPHQCTDCGRAFADGSKEMLSGCPDCGGNKFQFLPEGAAESPPEESPEPPERPASNSGVARTVGNAAATVRDLVGSSSPPEPAPEFDEPSSDDGGSYADTSATAENAAQADARTQVVSREEIDSAVQSSPAESTPTEANARTEPETRTEPESETRSGDDRPDLSELRDELNDQFESIRVVAPGQYELNLMELYDREEYIIALQEDGKYTIQVPDSWRD
ncbi:Zn-ribbon containing protein [Haloarculaceae archaeon H-GB11]|nr:Zn-ribbon containing protein [Haloarculaceae archaeon H-GB11]